MRGGGSISLPFRGGIKGGATRPRELDLAKCGSAADPSPCLSPEGERDSLAVTIIDLGYGNLGSIRIAFERLGAAVATSSDAGDIAAADRLVLPGVGAAGFAMARLRALGLESPLKAFRRPLLGICLGMQLLFERSDEADTPCLGLLRGRVRRLVAARGRPVPHMGWSRLALTDESLGLRSGDYVWFAHSYACDPGPASIATADHGRAIPALVRKGNLVGCQFHPERSGEAGARFLGAFLAS